MSASSAPSSRSRTAFAAPAMRAVVDAVSTSAMVATLWGMVTSAPRRLRNENRARSTAG